MIHQLQKAGGIAALVKAAAYFSGMLFFIVMVNYPVVTDPVQKITLLMANKTGFYIITFIIYVVFGIALVILTLALYERLKSGTEALMKTATAFGIIWAAVVIAAGMIFNIGTGVVTEIYPTDPEKAATIWLTISTVQEGLGGGNEILGGIWSLLISFAALRSGQFSKPLNYLGLIAGFAGILSAIPPAAEITTAIFGLGQLIWFAWLGVIMLRNPYKCRAEVHNEKR